MTDATPRPPSPEPPPLAQPVLVKPAWNPSLIWLVPAIAIAIGIGLAIQFYLQRGPEIAIQFAHAEGLEAGKTRLKYKDVDIGTVRRIALSDDRKAVIVTAQMARQADTLLVQDTRFWIVRPRVAAGGISGLATVFSGVHIAVDPGKSEEQADRFVGLETPPQVTSDAPGKKFTLQADDLGSLDMGAPIYFRRIQVGRVVGYAMQPDGRGVEVQVFVDAPYDRFVTARSRFWHASGVDVALNADGVKVDLQSLLSLMLGGIAFASPEGSNPETEAPAGEAAQFMLHADRAAAMRVPDTVIQNFVLVLHESLRGLAVGAPVDFRGLTVGEVVRIDVDFDEKKTDFAMLVEINLYPERFARRSRNAKAGQSGKLSRPILDTMVAKGFRAQIRTGNLLSGQRYVALDFFPKAAAAKVNWHQEVPELPTQPGLLDSLQEQLMSVADTLQHSLRQADQLMVQLNKELAPEFNATLKDARSTLDKANRLLASDAPLQQELRESLREVGRAARSVRDLADLLERRPEVLITGKKED